MSRPHEDRPAASCQMQAVMIPGAGAISRFARMPREVVIRSQNEDKGTGLKTRHYKQSWLRAQEIGLEAGVAVFVGPEGEGDGSEVID
jgi:hypothetical protein